jgi:predicted amidohydrolase
MDLAAPFVAASVQMDIAIGDICANMERVKALLHQAASNGARLVVFPECATSGYCFGDADEARRFAIQASDPILTDFAETCRVIGVIGVLGFLERDGAGYMYNSALLALADRTFVYRKTHLPTLGVDRFVLRGSELPVLDAGFARLGPLICYDVRFPEAARVLTLRHADVIVLPTNWPEGAETAPEYVLRARARENGVAIVAANRVGIERGRRFIGRSQIVAADGTVLAQAGGDEETLLAEIDPRRSRRKRIVIEPREWEQDTVGDRRPELYGDLCR